MFNRNYGVDDYGGVDDGVDDLKNGGIKTPMDYRDINVILYY